jgi:glycosyltransferase involved in cell wall biosynthesis
LVAQSRDTARNVEEIYQVSRHVERIPLGIDCPPRTEGANRGEFNIAADAFVLVTAGRIVARKATEQLLDTLEAVTDAILLVIGDGPEAEKFKQSAAARNLIHRIRMLGYVSDDVKFRAYQIADVFVSTSQHEGFGLVFLEAMAFGLPIVCYNRGGQTDFLSTPATGAVIALNDIRAFNEAVVALRNSRPLRLEVCRANLQRVQEYFIDECATRYEQVFEHVISQHAAG